MSEYELIAIEKYGSQVARMGRDLIKNDGFTIRTVMEDYSTILSEVETWFEDAEEVGSSDWFYLRMSILQTLGKPSIYSKEINKYNEMYKK
jgi:hypothetical protein